MDIKTKIFLAVLINFKKNFTHLIMCMTKKALRGARTPNLVMTLILQKQLVRVTRSTD